MLATIFQWYVTTVLEYWNTSNSIPVVYIEKPLYCNIIYSVMDGLTFQFEGIAIYFSNHEGFIDI
jgi:hypothetical protein